MKRGGFFLILLLGIAAAALLVKNNVGDIRPSLFPTKKIGTKLNGNSPKSDFPYQLPEGFRMDVFAKGVDGARDLQVSPGGTVILSQPSEGRVVALPDRDDNGVSEEIAVLVDNLQRPHGIAFHGDKLFIAEETRVVRYNWDEQNLKATFDKKILDLPRGGRHFTRTLAIEKDGTMYISLGSTCDTCFEKHPFIAAVIISTTEGKTPEVFAKGLRNPVFIKLDALEKLWGTEMGRDFLGDALPPDEINILERGKDYGWPVCYGDRVYDTKFGQRNKSYCENTESPAFKLPAHVAPLGLTFIDSDQFPDEWQGDLLVGLHGSWNSSVPVGYKVIRLKINDSKIVGMEDFITGFIDGKQAIGRPVDVEFGPDGSLYVSDDKAGAVYKVTHEN